MKRTPRTMSRARSVAKENVAAAGGPGKKQRRRIRLLTVLFVLPFAAVTTRLVMFQTDPDLRFNEEELYHIASVAIPRPRGEIFDTKGRVLATNKDVPSLSANPSKVKDPEALAAWLAPRLGEDAASLESKLVRKDKHGNLMQFVWLKRRMTSEEFTRLGDIGEAPNRNALTLEHEPMRSYPEGELAAHIIGFANRENVGSEGLESRFNTYLQSKAGRRVSRTDRQQNMMGFRTLEFEPPSGGDDVYLTIDSSIQFSLEKELDRAIADNNASRAMGIILDPKTGAVLAMATRPAFDPNDYNKTPPERRRNGAIIDMFEPGSAFKIVTAAAALELGLVEPGDPIDCMGGRFNPYGHSIRDTHPMNVVPFSTCFAASSNIAMIKVAALIGPERFESWIHRFGFAESTRLGLPGEEKGLLSPRARWSRLTMGSLPMGQEISVTLTQLARGFSVIANGGVRVEPYLVDEVRSKEGALRWKHESKTPERIISEPTAATMRELCYEVITNKDGTGSYAAIPEYRVGGKTGTAQIAMPGGGGYYADRYTAVFAGFAPVNDPRVTCVIVVQEPMQRMHFGGYVCGPVFQRVVREALIKLNVPPDPMDPALIPKRLAPKPEVVERVQLAAFEPTEEGMRFDGLELLKIGKDDTYTGPRLPSFVGMSKREAKELAVSLGIAWDPQGAGRVVNQDPPAGTPLHEVRQCTLMFAAGVGP